MIRRLLTALAGILAALVVVNSVLMPVFVRHGREVEIPAVTGKTLNQAVQALAGAHLTVRDTLERTSPTVPRGYVVDQRPRAKQRVKTDRGVLLVVSQGGIPTQVPDLAGQTLRFARLALGREGYDVGDVLRVPSSRFSRNFVIASDPPSSEMLGPGGHVHLLVSDGPERGVWVMPNLRGKDLDLTADRLNGAGFVTLVDRSQSWNAELVYTSLPPPGALVAVGDTIRLYGR
jgi:serine/threonine-protein kinase